MLPYFIIMCLFIMYNCVYSSEREISATSVCVICPSPLSHGPTDSDNLAHPSDSYMLTNKCTNECHDSFIDELTGKHL